MRLPCLWHWLKLELPDWTRHRSTSSKHLFDAQSAYLFDKFVLIYLQVNDKTIKKADRDKIRNRLREVVTAT
jgi:hypothetical protein